MYSYGKWIDCGTNELFCPHCGKSQEEETFYTQEEYVCDKCGKDFAVEIRFRVRTMFWKESKSAKKNSVSD